jgi:hypothetical protein
MDHFTALRVVEEKRGVDGCREAPVNFAKIYTLFERMVPMRSNKMWGLALLVIFLIAGPAADAAAQQTATVKEPDPFAVLLQMCDYLKSLQQFSFRGEVTTDEVYLDGKKLQYGMDMETLVKRPDKLRVNAEGDLVSKQFFFDGKTIILYDEAEKVYGAIDVPPSIEEALDKAHKDFGLRVALTDLASPQLWDHISRKIEHSLYVGVHKVRGVPCHHLALDGGDVHLQVWIDAGTKPLPRKVVFLQKKLEGSPQWTAYLSDWKTALHLADKVFRFVPPPGVQKIEFVPAKQPTAPGKEKGDKS